MMKELKKNWFNLIDSEIKLLAVEKEVDVLNLPELSVSTPPKAELGDLAFPMFAYSKALRLAPPQIASLLKERIEGKCHPSGELLIAGPYLNVKLDLLSLASDLEKEINTKKENYGKSNVLSGKNVMVEFSCPNTNKPLHLGHLRNDSIGESVSALLKAAGANVQKVNLINNRGIHICKSMWAYKMWGNGETPESTGEKGDHFVGRYYVRYATYEKEFVTKYLEEKKVANDDEKAKLEAEAKAIASAEAQSMLKLWEEGDEETVALWQLMNDWTLSGLAESYKNMGISFDKYYYESETYKFGKDEVYKGLDKGVFYKAEDGSVRVDLAPINLDNKVLLRKDGTSIYMTQDLGTAVERHKDWPFDSLVYVVASEQDYHFKVLFYCLQLLGYDWAKELFHLSYGMVNLPSGRMKSREGTVVDADDLLKALTDLAKSEIIAKEREAMIDNIDDTSRKIALSALNYYLLNVTPTKDMIFNPEESIAFSGNTGPYLQYMGARISSMMRKFEEVKLDYEGIAFDSKLLTLEDEKALIKMIATFPELVERGALNYDPSVICNFLYDLSKAFSKYYHDYQILKAETKELVFARVTLSKMILQVLKNAFALVGVPYLESM